MNKQIILVTVLLLTTFLYSQKNIEGKVIYKVSLEKPDFSKIENDTTRSKETKQIAIKMLNNIADIETVLYFSNNESLYKPIEELKNEAKKGLNLTKILAGKGKFYINNSTKEFLHQKDFGGSLFLIAYKSIQWNLTQDVKQIGDYMCYKATLIRTVKNTKGEFERKITAWYTPQIPINFGPQEFNGLPGIILELDYGKIIYSAIKIELNPTEQIIIKKPTKGKKKTEKEYNEIVKDAASGLFEKKMNK